MCRREEIAEGESIPPYFLGKVLGALVREGLLQSAKGPTGGFLLAKPAEKLTLYEIKAAVDGIADFEECVAGLDGCRRSERCCPLHKGWQPLQLQIRQYFQQTTLADLVQKEASKEGRGI